jgi:hypothetical protein
LMVFVMVVVVEVVALEIEVDERMVNSEID